jgi:glycosyltransferase involved in cell wall biosynthesis
VRIAIDARWVFPELSGIGRYTRELIRQLAAADRENEYVLLFRDPAVQQRTAIETRLDEARHVCCERIPWDLFSPWSQVLLPRRLRRLGVDAYHSPNYMVPLAAFPRHRRGPIRCVVTIHDLIPLVLPDHAPRSRKSRLFPLYRALMREVARRASRIITVSETSRRDAIAHLRIPGPEEHRVVTIPNGVSPRFCPGPAAPPAAGSAERSATVLYVGRADPYKNLPVLIDAVGRLRQRGRSGIRLHVVGAPDPRYPQAARRAAEQGLGKAVTWTGYLAEADLVCAYREAAVLVLPSRYEGFGLPVLEAMASGTPVVCSDVEALREVGGDAALYAPAGDADALAAALAQVLDEPGLRRTLIARGLARAARFTWAATAERTLAVYRDACSAP